MSRQLFGAGPMLAAALISCASSHAAVAADIELVDLGDGYKLIAIEGDIVQGDEEKFRRLSVQHDSAVIALASDGGALAPAIEIGKMIRLKEYPTLVLDGFNCSSACALIWVAGSTRFLAPNGRVGFHASYKDVAGKRIETGLGNALVGRYLTLLNLPEKAVVFATAAPPDRILWLRAENMGEAGISFETFGDDADEPPPIVRRNVRPPPVIQQVREAPPPVITPSAPSAASSTKGGWVQIAVGGNKRYYMDQARIFRVGRYVAAWTNIDASQDDSVAYYKDMELSYYDCQSRKRALKKSTEYDQDGVVLKSYDWSDRELQWDVVVPDSVGEAKLDYACRFAR